MAVSGTYERKLDSKGRLLLPPPVKDSFQGNVRVFPAIEVDALYVFTDENFDLYLDGLFANKGGYDDRNRDDQELMRQLNAMAVSMEVDSASRIAIPQDLRSELGLAGTVTVVGNRNRLELWNPETWKAYQTRMSRERLRKSFFARESDAGAQREGNVDI